MRQHFIVDLVGSRRLAGFQFLQGLVKLSQSELCFKILDVWTRGRFLCLQFPDKALIISVQPVCS